MKRIIILISVCFTIACTTQKQVIIRGKRSYTIPKESQQISPNQVATKFPDLGDKSIANLDDKLFNINGMLVGLSLKQASPDKDYTKPFDFYKNQWKSVLNMAEYRVNDITLKTYNNQIFVVEDYESDKDNFFLFKSFQKGSYNVYNGFIRYSKHTSKEQAYKLLDGILNSVKVLK